MDLMGRVAASVLLALAAGGGLVAPWTACARQSDRPALHQAAILVYDVGHRVCTQRPDRSFAACGRPWPVCGRCAGLYLGAAAGAFLVLLVPGRRQAAPTGDRTRHWRLTLLAAAAPTAALWTLEHGAGIDPGTLVRFAGALPLGVAGAAWLGAVARGHLR